MFHFRVTRNRRPLVTLQLALDLADSYIRQEKIDLSNYYLLLAKPSPYTSQGWLFRWARVEGEGEGYIEIAVSMEGEASRVKIGTPTHPTRK